MSSINICNFPTKVIIVDDNENFLDSLKLVIDHNSNSYDRFFNPHLAKNYLNKIACEINFLQKTISVEVDENDLLSVDLRINNLYKEIYNPERFKNVSLLITDYAMPGINGLELCQKLNNTFITRILLTGIADESIAIKAFNDGFIEQFIRKLDRTVIDSLRALILRSQEKYFESVSKNYTSLFNRHQRYLKILSDRTFVELFHDIIKKEKIIEYYLLDSFGSFLMLTSSGETSALFITTSEQHKAILSFARYENCPTAILQELESKTQTLWFYENLSKPNNLDIDWEVHLIPINKLNPRSDHLYYSYTTNLPFIDKEKIASFDAYKNQNTLVD